MLRRALAWPVMMAAVVLGSQPALVTAADTPLDAFPDSVSVIVRLKSPNRTINNVAAFVNQAQPGMGFLIQQQAQGIGILISNPTLAGVDRDADWWAGIFARGEDEPAVVFAIPASDANAMKQALGQGLSTVEFEKWVLYSEDEQAISQVKSRIGGTGQGASKLVDKSSQQTIDRGDLAIFVNVRQLRNTYREQLDEAKREVDRLLENVKNQISSIPLGPEAEGLNIAAILDLYGAMIHGILQAVEDTNVYAVGLAIDQKGIRIEESGQVAADSPTDRFLKSHQPGSLALIGRLPANQLAYFGLHSNMAGLSTWGLKFFRNMFELDEETDKALEEVTREYGKLKFGSYVGSMGLAGDKAGALRTVVVTEVSPTDKMRALTEKATLAAGNLKFGAFEQKAEYKKGAEALGDRPVDLITIHQEFDPSTDPLGIQTAFMKAFYGEEGMQTRVVFLENKVVQTVGGGRDFLANAVRSIEAKNATPTGPVDALKQLGETGNVVAMIDLPRTVLEIGRLLIKASQLPVPIDVEALDNLKFKPSYMGVGITTEPHGFRCRLVIPVEQVQGIMQLANELRKMWMQQPAL